MSSSSSVSIKIKSDVICMSVKLSFPKLKSWIVSWVSVFVKSSASSKSGSCLRSSCSDGEMKDAFAGG